MHIANIKNHFCTITKHKMTVMKLCFRVGLIKQGLLHDLSKYSPTEFISGVKYYQGYRSPNAAEKLEKGYSLAWLHHKGRNKHHFEYWCDLTADIKVGLVGTKMPLKYVLEMACDRIAASMVYEGEKYTDASAFHYFYRRKGDLAMHPDTSELLEKILRTLMDKGEDEAFAYMRYLRKHPECYESISDASAHELS